MLPDELRSYITVDEPFGPTDSNSVKHNHVAKILFDVENKIYKEMRRKPSIIVGRKGSGKTAFLKSLSYQGNYNIVVEIKAWEAFSQVVQAIEHLTVGAFSVESVSDVWEMTLWNSVILEIERKLRGSYNHRDNENSKILSRYVSAFGDSSSLTPESIMISVLDMLQNRKSDTTIGAFAGILHKFYIDGIAFDAAKDAAVNILNDSDWCAAVVMDAMEGYDLRYPGMERAISGLLHLLGRFNFGGSRCEFRLCLPAELYHFILENCSRNPMKDFRSHVSLHWVQGELVKIAAHRYSIFLQLYHKKIYSSISHHDLTEREGAMRFFNSLFPHEITNGLGNREMTVAYILRHTQLLPRQLLAFLNTIADVDRGSENPIFFQEEAIKKGIRRKEPDVAGEVFAAYKFLYPNARDVCEKCLRQLPLYFRFGELHKVFNKFGKRPFGSDEFDDFVRMLVELGVIGRVIGTQDRSGRYKIGRFEYTEPNKLIISSDDTICVHPVFSEVFQVRKKSTDGQSLLAVYPYGTDNNDEDYRDF